MWEAWALEAGMAQDGASLKTMPLIPEIQTLKKGQPWGPKGPLVRILEYDGSELMRPYIPVGSLWEDLHTRDRVKCNPCSVRKTY